MLQEPEFYLFKYPQWVHNSLSHGTPSHLIVALTPKSHLCFCCSYQAADSPKTWFLFCTCHSASNQQLALHPPLWLLYNTAITDLLIAFLCQRKYQTNNIFSSIDIKMLRDIIIYYFPLQSLAVFLWLFKILTFLFFNFYIKSYILSIIITILYHCKQHRVVHFKTLQ